MRLFAFVLLVCLLPASAFAQQNVVYPETAGQNPVRWDEFDWKYVDLVEDEGAGLRLYFYRRERDVAERAAAAIVEEYRWLVKKFDYLPQSRIPYILYNSHGELEQTNVFPIGEGTLGVTSPLDLKMTASYWGDHSRFRHVSLHEMVHQFTIQKVNGSAERAGARGSPLEAMPLWFIEGLAEYYSTPGGLGSDDEHYIRDLVANGPPERGYGLPKFFSDDVRSFLHTYKLGQVRVFFLADTYGEAKLQELLGSSALMRSRRRSDEGAGKRAIDFEDLVARITGDDRHGVQAKWEDWIKKRYLTQYLSAKQPYSAYREVRVIPEYADWFTVSPEGDAIVWRTADPWTGSAEIRIGDPLDPSGSERIAQDGKPGIDSLAYFDRPIVALRDGRIAWAARRNRNDVIKVGKYRSRGKERERDGRLVRDSRVSLSGFRTFDPESAKIREVGSPAFSPDGKKLAFVGLDDAGILDVWVLDLASGKYERITNDIYAERELDWGDAGIVYSSDATETRRFALFLAEPDTRESRRVTWTNANHRQPRFSPEGQVAFSSDATGKWDVYLLSPEALEPPSEVDRELTAGQDEAKGKAEDQAEDEAPALVRATDVPVSFTHPAFGGERLYAMGMKGGRFRVFSIERDALLSEPVEMPAPFPYEPWDVPTMPLTGVRDYSVLTPRAWQLENAFAAIGGGNGLYGAGFLLFQDQMRDRTIVTQMQAFGAWELTDVQVLYLDQTRRTAWGTVAFMSPGFVYDHEFSTNLRPIWFLEQRFGAAGIVQFPLNRYVRLDGSLGAAAVTRSVPKWLDNFETPTQREAWLDETPAVGGEIQSSIGFGYDTIHYAWETGPLAGSSVLAGVTSYYQPDRESWFGDARVDAQKYFRVWRTANLGFRVASGQSLGDEWRRPFYLSSVDNLRGVPWYKYEYLIGDAYAVGNAELQIPLGGLVRIALFDSIEGVGGVDVGSVFDRWSDAEERSTAAFVTGINFGLAIFDIRLHFARPFSVGGIVPGETIDTDGRVIVPDGWVTNFSLRYRFF